MANDIISDRRREKLAEYSRRYRERHPDRRKATQDRSEAKRQRPAGHLEKMRRYAKTDAARARRKEYESSDEFKDRRREYDRKRSHRKRTAQYRELGRLANGRRRARKREACGEFTAEDYRLLCARQKKCYLCGKRFSKTNPPTIDHIIALAAGGLHDRSNIALACGPCNYSKQAKRTHLL